MIFRRTDFSRAAAVIGVAVLLSALAGCANIDPPITVENIFLRPSPQIVGTPADVGFPNYETIDVPIGDSRKVSIWWVHADKPKATVVIIPGSDRNKSRYLIGLPVFIPNGYDVILMDYEGFGESTGGKLELSNLLDDGLAVVDYAHSRTDRVVTFGISTGTPVAAWVASQRDLAGCMFEACLILELEPELYLRDYLNLNIPVAWDIAQAYIAPQIPDGFDILKYMPRVDESKFFMHSIQDDVTPFTGGLMVYAAAQDPKQFWTTLGAHGQMIELDPAGYTAKVVGWLDANVAAK